jgi:hypothetical protein
MKKEIAFFKDKRTNSADTLIALYRSMGMTDAEIKQEMLRLQKEAMLERINEMLAQEATK